ncbi:MAG: hypothetical protein LBK22_07870 [Tannerella sp.]|nr:hypothetical protein [Tannerella sp.]
MKTYPALLALILCTFPLPSSGQLGKITKKKLNGLFTTEVDFSRMRLSLFRKFPRTYLALEDFRMVGTGAFEGDTLIACKKATATFSLLSVVRRKHIKIKSVRLEQPRFHARVTQEGQASWHILKRKAPPKEQTAPEPPPPPESRPKAKAKARPPVKVSAGRIEVCDADITYSDDTRRMRTEARDADLLLVSDGAKGDSAAGWTVQLHVAGLDIRTGDRYRMRQARIGFDSRITSDAHRRRFGLAGSRLQVNELEMRLDGSAGKQGNDLVADLAFDTGTADFRRLLSLFPAISLRTDFDSLQTAGHFRLDGFVKGAFGRGRKPLAGLRIRVDSARLGFPRLPEAIEQIGIAMSVVYDGVNPDSSRLDIDRLHLEPGGRPFDLSLHLKTPQSDLQIAGAMKGIIRCDSLARAIPMGDTQLTGFMECDLSLEGRMSALEKEPFEHFHAQGMLELHDITLLNSRFPEGADLPNLSVNFTPRVVKMLQSMAVGMMKK